MAETISIEEARARIATRSSGPLSTETVTLADALGRCLAVEIGSPGPWPTTDRSAMDGFGVALAEDAQVFGDPVPVVGESLAGHPFEGEVAAGTAVRIMTGAVVPPGVDGVVPVERTDGYEGETVRLDGEVRRGDNIRPRGSELAAGTVVLTPGTRLRAAEVGVLAVLGYEQVEVARRPRVAVLATGDEVVPLGEAPAAHQVRNSNAHALAAQIEESGGEALHLGIARDDRGDLEERVRRGLSEADVLISIGGVSKGTHDLVHATFAGLGVSTVFHGVTLKPGKPTFFGEAQHEGAARWVFGLPGNPASCVTMFDLCVRPLLMRCSGGVEQEPQVLPLGEGARFRKNWRTQAIPARLEVDGGHARLVLLPLGPSGDPFGLRLGTGYALIPGGVSPAEVKEAPYVPYASGAGLQS